MSTMPVRNNCYPLHTRQTVIVQYFEHGRTFREIADSFQGHPCKSTVRNIVNEYLADPQNGLIKLGKSGSRHLSRMLTDFAAEELLSMIEEHEGASLHEIADELQNRTGCIPPWSRESVYVALNELGYSLVRVTKRAAEGDELIREAFSSFCIDNPEFSDMKLETEISEWKLSRIVENFEKNSQNSRFPRSKLSRILGFSGQNSRFQVRSTSFRGNVMSNSSPELL